jgi:hypothetical protein
MSHSTRDSKLITNLLQNGGENVTKILQKVLTFFAKYNILTYVKIYLKIGGKSFGNR